MKHTTIKDIARSLNVSISTVSRALTNDKNIRAETREAILAEAKRLGYRRNPVAMNLKTGRSNTIGVLVPEMHTPHASQVVAGIQGVLYAHGFKVILAESDENPEREREHLQMMDNFMIDGLIVNQCSWRHNNDVYTKLMASGLPIIFYDRLPNGLENVSRVRIDDNSEAYFMSEHLIRLGCKNIVYIAGPDDIYNSFERLKGYEEAMCKFNIYRPDLVFKAGMTFEDGAHVVDKLIEEGLSFDAISAFTDTQAIGAMNRLRHYGLSVPNDVRIAGFSGTELSTIVYPQLTTVEAPLNEMGVYAANLLLDLLSNPNTPPRQIILKTEKKYRWSTGE